MTRTLLLLRSELGFWLARASFWVYFAILCAFAFWLMLVFGGAFPGVTAAFEGSDGTVLLNSPYLLLQLTAQVGVFGTVVVAAIAGNAGYRDFGDRIHPLVFTTTTSKLEYLSSRIGAALLVSALAMLGVGLGLWVAAASPWVREELFGPQRLEAYLQPYGLLVLPNVLLCTAIFSSMAFLTRKRLPHYLGGAGMLLGYLLARALTDDIEVRWIGALADPFGMSAAALDTEYWTSLEKNTRLHALGGWLLLNRLLWIGIAGAILAATAWRMQLSQSASESVGARAPARDLAEPPAVAAGSLVDLPTAHRTFGRAADLAQLRTLTACAFREVVLSPYFGAILLAGALFLVLSATQLETIYGTRTWPLTWKVIEVLNDSFGLFLFVLLALYGGELVWRERDLKLDALVDATPVRSWIAFTSKLAALAAVAVLLLCVVAAAGVLSQAALGYYRFEPALYLQKLFGMQLVDSLLLATLSLSVHTLVNHKYAGHSALLLVWVFSLLLPIVGVEHALWRYGSDLGQTYSDMNRHGWFLAPFLWFKLYWAGIALVLVALANLMWPRGADRPLAARLREARLRAGAGIVALGVLGASLALGAGGFIFWNTNVRHEHVTASAAEANRAAYERAYKQYEALPQPRIVGTKLEVDLYPERGDLALRGTYRLRNTTDTPIAAVHVLLNRDARIRTLELAGGARLAHEAPDFGYRIFELALPLAPGAESSLTFDLAYLRDGFAHTIRNRVLENGSFVSRGLLPSLGYDRGLELALDRERAKYDLEPRPRMADLDDVAARDRNYVARDGDWLDFEATVSTSSDQIALAPGYLQREWEQDGRRYFHYKMDRPILNLVAFLSARWVVVRDTWQDVPIEVYHHPGHEFNVARMIDSVKKSLAYFTKEFSAYQHRQLRILEFPRYEQFAQSLPNTVPYSESIGFIARVRDEDIDYTFYVTAHEVAHQWWAHQVVGADAQGSTVLSETLAQYSALMVMEREFGPDKMRRFLAYELDRYLRGRSTERLKEVPLLRVEDQGYIHYDKGSIVMYSVRDAIGEAAVNRALAKLLEQWAFRGPPYPTSRQLLDALLVETPEDLRPWVRELFEQIVLYENRATGATSRPLGNGRHEVTIRFEARKLRAGETGEEIAVALDDPIDIGVFDAEDRPLYLTKHRLDGSQTELTVQVEGEPASAGIDPYHKLIDRHPDDNETRVEPAS